IFPGTGPGFCLSYNGCIAHFCPFFARFTRLLIMRLRCLLGALCAAFSMSAAAVIPATEITQAVEFYHAQLDNYVITADDKEKNDLDTGVHPGWTRTGYRFSVIKAGSA